MDEVTVHIKMNGADYVLMFQLARQRNMTVEQFIINLITQEMLKAQQQWMQQQQQTQNNPGSEQGDSNLPNKTYKARGEKA